MRLLVLLGVVLVPALAFACPTCGLPLPQTKSTYEVMSIILSLLPLGMVFGVVGYVAHRVRVMERDEQLPPR